MLRFGVLGLGFNAEGSGFRVLGFMTWSPRVWVSRSQGLVMRLSLEHRVLGILLPEGAWFFSASRARHDTSSRSKETCFMIQGPSLGLNSKSARSMYCTR